MGESLESCESGGASTTEALAALAFWQRELDTVTVDIRVQMDRLRYDTIDDICPIPPRPYWVTDEEKPENPDDPNVFALLVYGHKRMRGRGKMVMMPRSIARRYQRMGVVCPMTEEEVEQHAKEDIDATQTMEVQRPDICAWMRTAARVHHGHGQDGENPADG